MIARGSAPREECGSTGLLAITTVADSVVKRFSFKREFHGLAKASSVVDLCLRHGREPREHPIDRDGLWPVAYGLGMIRGPTDYTTTFKPHDFSLSPTSPHSFSVHYCHVDRIDYILRNKTYFKRDKKEKMPCDN